MKSAGHAISRKLSLITALRHALSHSYGSGCRVRATNTAMIHSGDPMTSAMITDGAQYTVKSRKPTAKNPASARRKRERSVSVASGRRRWRRSSVAFVSGVRDGVGNGVGVDGGNGVGNVGGNGGGWQRW